MGGLIAWASGAVVDHPALALVVAFAGAVIEAVVMVGVVVPGTPMLMAVAAAASVAGQPMWPILLAGVLGAILGDGLSFWVGHRYGARLRGMWPFRSRPQMIGRAEAFFRRFGMPSVALARFAPVLRSTVPLVAGMTGMKLRRFVLANVLSALVWAPVHVYPAQLAGVALNRWHAGGWWAPLGIGAALLALAAGAVALPRLGRVGSAGVAAVIGPQPRRRQLD